MIICNQIIFVLLLLCLTQCLVKSDVNLVSVITSSGTVRGQTLNVLNKQINQYLNIPYAQTPTGQLRFAKPVPLKHPKQDVIDGTKAGNYCIQYMGFLDQLTGDKNTKLSEHCLVLNIWTPNINNNHGQLKPVMFYIPGGAFSIGSIFQDIYNSSVLSTNDVVVATVNYRVGPLGFLYGGDETAPGNLGLYDQLLGLKWVRQNIHMFGGNKDAITIFGHSAGSWSVSAHILSPLSKGLFSRAIMQSGSVMYNKDRPAIGTVEGLANAKQLAQQLGCDPYDYHWLDCLRAIDDPNLFIDKPKDNNMFIVVHPVFGTEFLPVLPQKAFENGLYNSDVELMAGVTKNEGQLLATSVYPESWDDLTETQFWMLVYELSNEYRNIDVRKVGDYYLNKFVNDKTDPAQLKLAFSELYGHIVMTCPTYLFAKRMAINGQSVHFYRFNYQSSIFLRMYRDVCAGDTICHGSDVPYVFGMPLVNQQVFTEIDYDFSIDIMKILTDFAKTGKPHNNWPKLLDPSDMNGVSKVKDLNPNDMSIVLDNQYDKTCDGVWSDYY